MIVGFLKDNYPEQRCIINNNFSESIKVSKYQAK